MGTGTRVTLAAAALFMLVVALDPDRFWTAGLTVGFSLLLMAGLISLGEKKSTVSGPLAGISVAIIILTGLSTAYAEQIRVIAAIMALAALVWLVVWLVRRHRRRTARPRPT